MAIPRKTRLLHFVRNDIRFNVNLFKAFTIILLCHSRESGNPVFFYHKNLDPRFHGDDKKKNFSDGETVAKEFSGVLRSEEIHHQTFYFWDYCYMDCIRDDFFGHPDRTGSCAHDRLSRG